MSKSSDESKSPDRPLRAGFMLHDVSRLRRTVYDQRLKPMGITRSQWWVLSNLSRQGSTGLMQIELARLLDVGKVTLGGLIDRLEESGYVQRVPDPVDRRSKRVIPSEKGKALVARLEGVGRNVNKEIMKGISADDEAQLVQILSRMKNNLIELEAVPAVTAGRKAGRAER